MSHRIRSDDSFEHYESAAGTRRGSDAVFTLVRLHLFSQKSETYFLGNRKIRKKTGNSRRIVGHLHWMPTNFKTFESFKSLAKISNYNIH